MAFSVAVEMLNLKLRRRAPIRLHKSCAERVRRSRAKLEDIAQVIAGFERFQARYFRDDAACSRG